MTANTDIKRLRLYLWIGLSYLVLWLIGDLTHYPETFPRRFINNVWLVAFLTVHNFIFFEYSLPSFRLTWRKILPSIFLLWLHLMTWSFGLYVWRSIGLHLQIYTAFKTFSKIEQGVTYIFPYSVGSVVYFALIRHINQYVRLKQSAQQLRIEKQEAELNYLKSQTNPHFLFNTLNNIYSLSRTKSDLAPESILRLSKILRFMLYEVGSPFVAVEQELKILSDYIELEKLRYDESLRVNFNYSVEDMKQALPPLLLMPLVENAFKHGVSETRSRPFVDIHLSIQKRQLTFLVANSSESPADARPVKENIGLSNLRRQLELLYKDYELTVQQGNAVFTSTLKINLASHV